LQAGLPSCNQFANTLDVFFDNKGDFIVSIKSTINWFEVAFWIVLVEIIGMGSALLSGNIRAMYNSLTLPPFSPSGVVFGIVWPILYLLIGTRRLHHFGTIAKTTR